MIALQQGLILLFEQGGLILIVILITSVLMWVLILERYAYYIWVMPKIHANLLARWHNTRFSSAQQKIRLKSYLTLTYRIKMRQYLLFIHTLAEALPLLGLLGTIVGMITVFEVISTLGTGNARAMAAGISSALVTTMAGLVTALSGLYFSTHLETLVHKKTAYFEETLNHGGANEKASS